MRVLLDAHALIDMVNKAPSEADAVDQLKVMHEFQDVELWASAWSFAELASVVERACDAGESARLLEDALTWLRVYPIEGVDVVNALSVRETSYRKRVECVCAQRVGADFVITRNGVGEESRIPSGTVGDFMRFVERLTNVHYAVVSI